MDLSTEQLQELGIKVSAAFSPAAPIDKKALFAGRTDQVRRVIDVIGQRGQHVIIFGERGVGKTSLVNVLHDFLKVPGSKILAPKINCDGRDDYSSIWRKLFSEISAPVAKKAIGFLAQPSTQFATLADQLPNTIEPDLVRRILASLGNIYLLIVIIDEFDRVNNSSISRLFADTVKMLSDFSVSATLIMVGVADTVNELIHEHQSVERPLVQVRMPRMSEKELKEIIDKGLMTVGMDINKEARDYITFLSQGLPHYTHLLGLYAAREAIDRGQIRITTKDIDSAIKKALTDAQQTIQKAYHMAKMSTRRRTLYEQVLLACAMANQDELGYFAAADVRDPMCLIMKKNYDIPAFSRHLNDFCEKQRGPVLEKTGYRHRFRFRFKNPLMQPYVIMQGLASGMISRTQLPGECKEKG